MKNLSLIHLNQRKRNALDEETICTTDINIFWKFPNTSEQEPIDYFYSMFGKESFDILKDQSNLHSVQVIPNRSVNISDTDIRQLIGILNTSGVYPFSQQRFY